MHNNNENEAFEHFKWIYKIIMSCRDTFQMECAQKVIELFDDRWKDETLTTELKHVYQFTYNNIHSILN